MNELLAGWEDVTKNERRTHPYAERVVKKCFRDAAKGVIGVFLMTYKKGLIPKEFPGDQYFSLWVTDDDGCVEVIFDTEEQALTAANAIIAGRGV